MTPSKEKKALPSSSSFTNAIITQDHPTTYPQWQTALQHIKIQYLKRQYKQCASRCTQLLTANAAHILPLHRTYLHFYTALSHEALARSAYNLSAAKLRTLHLAREAYEAAAASLPRPTTLPATTTTDTDDDDEEEADSSASVSDTSSPTSSYSDPSSHAPEDNAHSPTPPQTPSRTPSRSPAPTAALICTDTENLTPSPLRIRKKAVRFTPTSTSTSTPSASPPRPQLTLLSPVLHSAHAASGYDTQLISFATMLQSHICAVDALLQATDAAQGYGAYVEDGDGEEEEEGRRARRIRRLKGAGWRRERFVAERYVGLCARALAEL